MWRFLLLMGGFLAVTTASPAAEPDDGEAPPTQPASATQPAPEDPPPADVQWLHLQELLIELGFEAAYDQHESTFDTGDRFRWTYDQRNRSQRFEETLGFRATGALIDDKVLLFESATRWGLTQERFSETGPWVDRSESPDGDLLEYDLSVTLFPRGKVSATAYAQQLDSRLPRAFQPSLDRTRERYGAGLFFNDPTLPMRLTFEHTWDELTSRTRDLIDDERRGRDQLRYEATWQIDKYHSLRLEYEYDDRSEQYSGSGTRFDTTRNYLLLNHVLRFGPKHRSAWENLARFQDESGDLARDTTELSTRLRLQHTDSLASNFAGQFLSDSFEELGTRTYRGEVGLTHQLDDLLTTTAQLYGLQQQADQNADFAEWGGLVNSSLNHENAWGRFSANVSYNHNATDTRNGTRRGVIIAESVTFRDPLPAYLAHTDVLPTTIIVTDANRTRTYLPGRDYLAAPLGRYTALYRVPNGAIADKETVLVTYVYRALGDYDYARDRLDFRVQQAFKFGLTPYYAGSLQNEDLDESRFLTWRARNVNRHRVGTTFRQRRWSVGVEYEYNDDAIDPYQAFHANGDVVLFQNARHQLDGKTTVSRFWFDGAEALGARNTTLFDVGLGYRCLLMQDLEANATAMYRYEDDSLFGDTHGVDLAAGLDWRIGYFTLRFEAEYDMLDLPDSRDNSMAFWIKLKRDIPVIAGRRR